MTQGTDVSAIATEVAGIQIDGPTTPFVEEVAQTLKEAGHEVVRDQTLAEVPATEPQIDLDPEPDFAVDPDAPDLDENDDDVSENPYAAGAMLFDTSRYLAVPTIDGQASDKISITFGGTISWDAADAEGRQVFEALTLGKAVELRVAGFVADKAGSYKENADGEETVTGKVKVKIVTFYIPTAEQL